MARIYNPKIAEAVKRFLNRDRFHYVFNNESGIFRYDLTLAGALKCVEFFIAVNETSYNVYAVSPVSATKDNPEQMRRMAEFVCRANYGLREGNFELDFNDGELRYKCFVNCEGSIPNSAVIRSSLICPAVMFNLYGDAILETLFNDVPVEDAIRLCKEARRAPETHSGGEAEKSPRVMGLLRRLHGGRSSSEGGRAT